MSTEQETNEIEETEELDGTEDDSVDIVRDFLSKIVPPTEVSIEDLYGQEYSLRTKISARSQIQLVREFEKGIKDIALTDLFEMDEEINSSSIIRAIMKVSTKEAVLSSVDKCFQITHPSAFESAKKGAKNDPYAPKKPTPIDLFSLEDILSAVLPLFLGLIKKGTNVLTLLAQ